MAVIAGFPGEPFLLSVRLITQTGEYFAVYD